MEDTAKGPHVASKRIYVAVDHLWAEVEWSANAALFDAAIAVWRKLLANSEVTNQKLVCTAKKQVLALQISVDDPPLVHVLQAESSLR